MRTIRTRTVNLNTKKLLLLIFALLVAVPSAGIAAAQGGNRPGSAAGMQPYLGVGYDVSDSGAVITEIVEDSPAAEAGLQVDDVITAVNEDAVEGPNLAELIRVYSPGDTVTLSVTRGDETLSIDVVLGAERGRTRNRSQLMDARPYLGVRLENTDEGVSIVEVIAGSPAEEIGLEVGDLITTVNGQEVATVQDVADAVLAQQPSAQLTLNVLRGGETLEFDVVLRSLLPESHFNIIPPQTFDNEVVRPYLGVQLDDTDAGIEILAVQPDSPAANAGLETGDIITAVNGEAVTTSSELAQQIRGMNIGDTITLTVERGEDTVEITATLGETVLDRMFRNNRGDMPGGRGNNMMINPNDFTYDEETSTWVVGALAEDSPFYEAGLREGDRITLINGETYALDDLDGFNFMFGMEDTVTLTVERGEETREIEVDGYVLPALFLSANPMGMFDMNGQRFDFTPGRGNRGFDLMPARPAGARLGVTFIMLDEQVASEFEVEQTEGAIITDLAPRSPADEAGLQVNDIVTAIDGEALSTENTLSDVIGAKQPGDMVTLDILREGESLQIEVTLGQPEQFGFFIPNAGEGFQFFPPNNLNVEPAIPGLEREFSL